ncbi:MAG: hypothetical protein JG781_2495 [Peptococcaceae bacterium]|nr:hypothetical protein [Peptococcaceae bacterium]
MRKQSMLKVCPHCSWDKYKVNTEAWIDGKSYICKRCGHKFNQHRLKPVSAR